LRLGRVQLLPVQLAAVDAVGDEVDRQGDGRGDGHGATLDTGSDG
jgi:hypothetical protein